MTPPQKREQEVTSGMSQGVECWTGSDLTRPAPPLTSGGHVPAGGSGALAQEAARLYPGSAVTVFDVPEVVAAARAQATPPGEGPHVSFVAGGRRHSGRSFRVHLINMQIYAKKKSRDRVTSPM